MSEQMITQIIIAIVGSGAFSAIVSAIVSAVTEKRKEKKGTGKLIMMLTADALYKRGEKFVEQGYADDEEYKLFLDMYEIYKDQEGNGYADDLKKRAEKLPIKK